MVAVGAFGAGRPLPADLGPPAAPASVLSPFMYTQLVWATRSAIWCSANVPNHWTIAGAAIVIASGLYLLHRERKVQADRCPGRARLTK